MAVCTLFISITRKTMLIFISVLLVCIMCSLLVVGVISTADYGKLGLTVVIDAGHGGRDGGCVGVNTNVKESDLNLVYASVLGEYFKRTGIKVVYTRTSKNGLYSIFGRNYKQEDMKNRKEIIETANADMVISIHMNTFPISTEKGAQVFYYKDSEESKLVAECIQKQFKSNLAYGRSLAKTGDYYILNCTSLPSILIECGFLSSPEEEQLLISEDYQKTLCYYIFCGVVQYFGVVSGIAI